MTRLNSSYPGGLASYIKTARELLSDSKAGKNPFDGYTPSVSVHRSHLFKYYIHWIKLMILDNWYKTIDPYYFI